MDELPPPEGLNPFLKALFDPYVTKYGPPIAGFVTTLLVVFYLLSIAE